MVWRNSTLALPRGKLSLVAAMRATRPGDQATYSSYIKI